MSTGGTTQQSGTSTSVNQIPQWMTDAGQQNYAYAQQVAEQPLQQYQGQMVADVSPQTQQSWNVAANSGNVGADQFGGATAGYLGALGQTPSQVTPQTLASTNLDPYMNPYTKDVINATMPGMIQANALSQNQAANSANSANAFGGSRQGIQQGVAQAQGAMNVGQMLAGLNSANFTQAQAAATGDISRNLTAQQSNQSAQQAKINSDIAASQGLTGTGQAMNQANTANFNMLQSAGASQSMQAQNEINAQMAKFNQAFNYPQQQLGTLESSLGMTPHDTSTAGQTTSQTTTPTDWASIISKGAGAAADIYGMSSDRSMKTDIKPLGKDEKTGLPMYSYRYKGDPKSYPKVTGPMAQDVEKQYPGSTTPMGKDGKLAIRGYAGGTSMVQPSLAGFTPPSSPLVAKGLGALTAFRPPVKLPRGATVAPMPKHFAFGTSNVTPDMDDVDLGMQMGGGGGISDLGGGGWADKLKKLSGDLGGASSKPAAAGGSDMQAPKGWGAPSMGYAISGFAAGTPQVPGFGSPDTVPSYLSPGEAVLTPGAARHVGRPQIAALNAMHPPTALPTFMPPVGSGKATTAMRAGARGITGALANTKLRSPKIAGGLSG